MFWSEGGVGNRSQGSGPKPSGPWVVPMGPLKTLIWLVSLSYPAGRGWVCIGEKISTFYLLTRKILLPGFLNLGLGGQERDIRDCQVHLKTTLFLLPGSKLQLYKAQVCSSPDSTNTQLISTLLFQKQNLPARYTASDLTRTNFFLTLKILSTNLFKWFVLKHGFRWKRNTHKWTGEKIVESGPLSWIWYSSTC